MMGLALGDEIDSQDKLLDRVHQKTERNDDVIRKQRKQVDKLLRR